MMKYKLRAFGITREIVGGRELEFETNAQTVADLKKQLHERYPKLSGLRSLLLAVNNEYAEDAQIIHEQDEIALIPPVSGG